MTYLVLARKWRPRSFDTLVGQEHVVRALTHALSTQRLHHAWLFTGTRGVGKTTLSRILAKSLNCQEGISATPCGVCQACTEIDAGRFVDYVELDAASNRGVEEMTQLLEQAVYAPSSGRFKVYMIDEVHMLTGHAFNAMLKTLEEPPPHVKFILATTDPQKIPVTVLSRCLQFNLKQMTAPSIVDHLSAVLSQEDIPFEVGALRLLAQAAGGSMRDALSLTDQAIAYSAGNLATDAVQGMLGTIDQRHLVDLLQALGSADATRVLQIADDLALRGLSYSGALGDLAVLLSRIAIEQRIPGAMPEDDALRDDVAALARTLHPDQVHLFYSIAVHSRQELSLAPDEYAGFVMACLRMLALVAQHPAPVSPAPPAGPAGVDKPTAGAPVAAPAESSATASSVEGSPSSEPPTGATPEVPGAATPKSPAVTSEVATSESPAAKPESPVATPRSLTAIEAAKASSGGVLAISSTDLVADKAIAASIPASNAAASKLAVSHPAVSHPDSAAASAHEASASSSTDIPAWEEAVHAASDSAAGEGPAAESPNAVDASGARARHDAEEGIRPQDVSDAGKQSDTSDDQTARGVPDGGTRGRVSPAGARKVVSDDHVEHEGASPRAQGDIAPPGVDNSSGIHTASGVDSPSDLHAASGIGRPRDIDVASNGPRDVEVSADVDGSRDIGGASDEDAAGEDGRFFTEPADDSFDDYRFEPADAEGDADAGDGIPVETLDAIAAPAFAPARRKRRGPRVGDMTAAAWPALAAQLPVTGLAAELARQSEWVGNEGDTVHLRVAIRTLAESPGKARLCTVLSEHFGCVVRLEVEYGATGDGTAHAVQQAQNLARQQAAEQAVKSDDFVRALIDEFGGQVIPNSIRPPAVPASR